MANMCEFLMLVKGKTENIELFFEALTQKRHIWMGRGACAELRYETDEKDCAFIDGECKWSIQSALIDDAISMRKQQNTGVGYWGDIENVDEFLTLFEACEKYHVNMEVYSREPGCEFQEHYKCEDGTAVINESTEWTEHFDEDSGDYEETGGYEWNFDLAYPKKRN